MGNARLRNLDRLRSVSRAYKRSAALSEVYRLRRLVIEAEAERVSIYREAASWREETAARLDALAYAVPIEEVSRDPNPWWFNAADGVWAAAAPVEDTP